MDGLSQIPGYSEAIRKENESRDLAFLNLPQSVCGIDIGPFTLRKYILLEGIGNPFVCGGNILPAHVAQFLWILSPGWVAGNGSERDTFTRKVSLIKYSRAVKEIMELCEVTFQDSPSYRGAGFSVRIVSGAASYVDILASEYGWSENTVLDMPIARLFQYVRLIQKRHDPKRTFINPSDKVRGKWLAEVNAEKAKAN